MANDTHYVEYRDTGGSGFWAVIAVLLVLFVLLFFGARMFGGSNNNDDATDINIRGNIETPSGGSSGTQ